MEITRRNWTAEMMYNDTWGKAEVSPTGLQCMSYKVY